MRPRRWIGNGLDGRERRARRRAQPKCGFMQAVEIRPLKRGLRHLDLFSSGRRQGPVTLPAQLGGRFHRLDKDDNMRSFDISPLLRSSIGYENLNRLVEFAGRSDNGDSGFPPYNIEKVSDGAYRIAMAVAGFAATELDLTVQENTLIVTGKADESDTGEGRQYLHRGIAKRGFERRFQLADTIKVMGARFENGLLTVELMREIPEHKKPRKVEIGTPLAPVNPRVLEAERLAAE